MLAEGCFEHLRSLDVGHETITDQGLVRLGELQALTTFNLWNTRVSKRGADLVLSINNNY